MSKQTCFSGMAVTRSSPSAWKFQSASIILLRTLQVFYLISTAQNTGSVCSLLHIVEGHVSPFTAPSVGTFVVCVCFLMSA